jgi:hypothetical protein
METVKAEAASVLFCISISTTNKRQRSGVAYLEIGGAAQNISIADMMAQECLLTSPSRVDVDNEEIGKKRRRRKVIVFFFNLELQWIPR